MTSPPVIAQVKSSDDLDRFIDVPFAMFKRDRRWVPPLRSVIGSRLSPYHPTSRHEEMALWVATDDAGNLVGRIGACVDDLYNQFHQVRCGWVGFFESVHDEATVKWLTETAVDWLLQQNVDQVLGPSSFTPNEAIGMLVEGFELLPSVMTPWNPPYYRQLWESAGWQPFMDLLGWTLSLSALQPSPRQEQVAARVMDRFKLEFEHLPLDELDEHLAPFFSVDGVSPWADNRLFMPMTRDELVGMKGAFAWMLKDPDLAWMVRWRGGEAIGVGLAMPDINQALVRMRSGKVGPVGALRMRRSLRRYRRARAIIGGFKPDYQMLGLGALVACAAKAFLRTPKPYLKELEVSYTLEPNKRINKALEAAGALQTKRWKLYEYALR